MSYWNFFVFFVFGRFLTLNFFALFEFFVSAFSRTFFSPDIIFLRMGKHLSNFELGRISGFNRSGWGAKRISKELKRSVCTIKYALKRMKNFNTYRRSAGSGRPRKTSERENRIIVRQGTTNCFLSTEKIRSNLKTKNLISKTTIRRRIHDKGTRGYVAARKPFVNEAQRKRRLQVVC